MNNERFGRDGQPLTEDQRKQVNENSSTQRNGTQKPDEQSQQDSY